MNPWQHRHAATDKQRKDVKLRAREHQRELNRVLQRLAARGHCQASVTAWLRLQKADQTRRSQLSFSPNADERMGPHPAVRLTGLSHLHDGAKLSVQVQLHERRDELVAYSIGVRGRTRDTDRPWYCRVDLHPDGEAELRGDSQGGFCNHPLLHCHVGADPDRREHPEVRVPVDWLLPHEVLEWLLATVEPDLEPAPRDKAEVDLDDPVAVARWCEQLGVTPERLRNLVRTEGPGVVEIKRRLARQP